MKSKLFLFGFATLIVATEVNAQTNNSGVYLSAQDFASKKISYEGAKIKTNLLFDPTDIKVIQGDQKTILYKINTYGYKSKDNKTYRYYNGVVYEVLNPQDDFLIYKLNRLSISKNQQPPLYFFSTSVDAPVQSLTIMNIKMAYPDDRNLHYSMDMLFRNDDDLLRYDNYYHQYKIVELVNEKNSIVRALTKSA